MDSCKHQIYPVSPRLKMCPKTTSNSSLHDLTPVPCQLLTCCAPLPPFHHSAVPPTPSVFCPQGLCTCSSCFSSSRYPPDTHPLPHSFLLCSNNSIGENFPDSLYTRTPSLGLPISSTLFYFQHSTLSF